MRFPSKSFPVPWSFELTSGCSIATSSVRARHQIPQSLHCHRALPLVSRVLLRLKCFNLFAKTLNPRIKRPWAVAFIVARIRRFTLKEHYC